MEEEETNFCYQQCAVIKGLGPANKANWTVEMLLGRASKELNFLFC